MKYTKKQLQEIAMSFMQYKRDDFAYACNILWDEAQNIASIVYEYIRDIWYIDELINDICYIVYFYMTEKARSAIYDVTNFDIYNDWNFSIIWNHMCTQIDCSETDKQNFEAFVHANKDIIQWLYDENKYVQRFLDEIDMSMC
jgi:hypothetical protein